MILPLFRVMTSMYTVSMTAVMRVSIAYDHFAGDSDLDNYSKMGPTCRAGSQIIVDPASE